MTNRLPNCVAPLHTDHADNRLIQDVLVGTITCRRIDSEERQFADFRAPAHRFAAELTRKVVGAGEQPLKQASLSARQGLHDIGLPSTAESPMGTCHHQFASNYRRYSMWVARCLSWAAITSLCLLLAACDGPMKDPDVKLNVNARMRYEILVTLRNLPGPFERIEGFADYRVADDSKVPEAPISGASLYPSKQIPIPLERIADNVFKGEFYADRLVDEDYYGKGVCHWEIQGGSIRLLGRPVRFVASIGTNNVVDNKTKSTFFARSFYNEDHPMTDTGANKAADFKQPDETFSVEIRTVKAWR